MNQRSLDGMVNIFSGCFQMLCRLFPPMQAIESPDPVPVLDKSAQFGGRSGMSENLESEKCCADLDNQVNNLRKARLPAFPIPAICEANAAYHVYPGSPIFDPRRGWTEPCTKPRHQGAHSDQQQNEKGQSAKRSPREHLGYEPEAIFW